MSKDPQESLRALMERNAETIRELIARIDKSLPNRDSSSEGRATWNAACAEFHARYDALSYPGGFGVGVLRVQSGEAEAIDLALSFLELRPYFFRSQYMRTKLTRVLKQAPLSETQSKRFQMVCDAQKQYARRLVSGPTQDQR